MSGDEEQELSRAELDELIPGTLKNHFMSPAEKHPQRRRDETPQASQGSVSERKGRDLLTHLQT